MTITVLNTKISEAENKISNVSGLVKKSDYDTKVTDIEGKYFTTSDYNKFKSDIRDAKIKQEWLVNKFHIFNHVKDSNINKKIATLATKLELKAEKNKNFETTKTWFKLFSW